MLRRTSRILRRSSVELTAPSTSVMSTSSGNSLASTSGPNTSRPARQTAISRSSMSRNDIWQPEQPSSQMVANLQPAHCSRLPVIKVRYGKEVLRFDISATDLPFSNSAPVGHTCTHLPQLVQSSTSPHGLVQVGDQPGVDASPHDVPGVRPLDLVAHPHAARTQDAAVMVEGEAVMRGVDRDLRVQVRHADVIDAEPHGQVLQLAVPVDHADRADVVALAEQELQDQLAIAVEPLGVHGDLHALFHLRHAGGQQLVAPLTSTRHRRQAPTCDKSFDEAQTVESGCHSPTRLAGWFARRWRLHRVLQSSAS